MNLPIPIDYPPAESEQADELPTGSGWQYEPKWDGFRCLAFRDGDEVELRSKAGKPLARYFPDVADALRGLRAGRFVLHTIPAEIRRSWRPIALAALLFILSLAGLSKQTTARRGNVLGMAGMALVRARRGDFAPLHLVARAELVPEPAECFLEVGARRVAHAFDRKIVPRRVEQLLDAVQPVRRLDRKVAALGNSPYLF